MPAGVRKSSKCPVSKPFEIYNKDTGKHYGCSTTKAKAQSSANARNASAHGWHPTGKK